MNIKRTLHARITDFSVSPVDNPVIVGIIRDPNDGDANGR